MQTKKYNLNTQEDIDILLKDIFKYLLQEEDNSISTPQFWIDGTCPDVQTTYEKLSNFLHICVRAKDQKVATVLLGFLRCIVDMRHPNRDWHVEFFTSEDNELTLEEAVETLYNHCDEFRSSFDPLTSGLYIERSLHGDCNVDVRKYIGEIDTWNIWRIGQYLGVLDIKDFFKSVTC